MLSKTAIFKKYCNLSDYDDFVNETLISLKSRFPQVSLKSFSEFKSFLDSILPKLIHKYMINSMAMKVCSTISPDFAEIAANAGYAVIVQHVPGHVRNIVLTTDGPYVVDLSYIQFLCNHDFHDKENRKEVLQNYKELYHNPQKAVKIEPMDKSWITSSSEPQAKYDNLYNPVESFNRYNIEEQEEDYPERFNRFK